MYIINGKGVKEKFNPTKIESTINSLLIASGESDNPRSLTYEIVSDVISRLEKQFNNVPNPLSDSGNYPSVHDINEIIEDILIDRKLKKTLKIFVEREIKEDVPPLNDISYFDKYLNRVTWEVNENANISHSSGGLIFYISQSVIKEWCLSKMYDQKIADAHKHGFFHIHDLGMGFCGYCAGWSLKDLLIRGFEGNGRDVKSSPPQHFETALGQLVNFIGVLQNEWAGAQAVNQLDTLLAPYVRNDKLSYKEVKQAIQSFVYSINVPSRWGGQSPFFNVTFDFTVPSHMRKEPVVLKGRMIDDTYDKYQKEVDMINKAFLEVMYEGDAKGAIFPFPIPTYNITKDFDFDNPNASLLFDVTSKYGIPYFQNLVNSNISPEDIRAMCCRLQLDLRQIRYKTGGIFGAGDQTGSIGVVTINLPRLAYLAKGKVDEFFKLLRYYLNLAKDSLEIKRQFIKELYDKGLFKFTKVYLPQKFETHFSTIGIIGANEACMNLFGSEYGIWSNKGRHFSICILNFIRNQLLSFQEETGNLYNLEATPAEGTSYRLAKLDLEEFGDDIAYQGTSDAPYYTNSTHLPVNYTSNPIEALNHQEQLQTLYTSGTVFHFYVGERLPDGDVCKEIVKRISYRYKIPYFSITPTFSICREHRYLSGEHETCPMCGESCEVYSRVVGYYRPVSNWNLGKQKEFEERKTYSYNEVLSNIA